MNRVIDCGNWEPNCESVGCSVVCFVIMASSNGNIFRVIGPLWRESIGYRWITPTKGSDTELMIFSLICASTKDWANSGDLQLYRAHYGVTVMAVKRINMAGHWSKYFFFLLKILSKVCVNNIMHELWNVMCNYLCMRQWKGSTSV